MYDKIIIQFPNRKEFLTNPSDIKLFKWLHENAPQEVIDIFLLKEKMYQEKIKNQRDTIRSLDEIKRLQNKQLTALEKRLKDVINSSK